MCAAVHLRRAPARLLFALGLLLLSAVPRAELLWFDGTRDATDTPPGKLLTDNDGYWGDAILTGVDYTYQTPPDDPGDTWRDKPDTFGRRLLDGRPAGNWWTPVGVSGKPLVVTLDLKRECRFLEVDLDTRSRKVSVAVDVSSSPEGPWQLAFQRGLGECPDAEFHRLGLPTRPWGRYLRLTVEAPGITWLDEVLVWGDAEVAPQTPEDIRPVVPTSVVTGTAFSSIPGIEKTSLSDAQFWEWRRALGEHAEQRAVWSTAPTWDAVTDRPLLPAPEAVLRRLDLTLARNETECACLALTNTSCESPADLELTLSPFRPAGTAGTTVERISARLRAAGAIGSRYYGVNLGPLFEEGNLLPPGLMQRYLANGRGVMHFPRVTLGPGGSAVLWVSVTSDGAQPGVYEARLAYRGGRPVLLRAQVLQVTLPKPQVWLQTWSAKTSMFPFVHADRQEREVAYKQSLGVTVWSDFPEPGSDAALARSRGYVLHHVWGLGDYGHQLYGGRVDPAKLTADDERAVADLIHGHVRRAQELGLSYDDWYVELTDEPGRGNAAAFGALARLIRNANPRVRLYCNPSFWEGSGCAGDDAVYEALSPWYGGCVDVSVPLFLLLQDRPRSFPLFDAQRFVRASYTVSTQSAKGERSPQVELYRRLAWDAFSRGWNGWGFYSYFAPRGNPWTDFDADWYTGEDLPDYQMVYPGPRGPIPTRQSEAVREGWEDYCLLTLLRDQGQEEALRRLLRAYAEGVAPHELRLQALRAAVQ